LSLKILIHVDFNLMSFIQLSALVGKLKVVDLKMHGENMKLTYSVSKHIFIFQILQT